MQRTTYRVGLSPDEVRMLPLTHEKHLTTLDDVYNHCAYIAQQLGAVMPINRKGLLEGVEEQDEAGATFVTLDFAEPEVSRPIAIIFERGVRKVGKRPKKVRSA